MESSDSKETDELKSESQSQKVDSNLKLDDKNIEELTSESETKKVDANDIKETTDLESRADHNTNKEVENEIKENTDLETATGNNKNEEVSLQKDSLEQTEEQKDHNGSQIESGKENNQCVSVETESSGLNQDTVKEACNNDDHKENEVGTESQNIVKETCNDGDSKENEVDSEITPKESDPMEVEEKDSSKFSIEKQNELKSSPTDMSEDSTFKDPDVPENEDDNENKEFSIPHHVPEKVLDLDEDTRMSMGQTAVESTFNNPLPPKQLFVGEDTNTKDSEISQISDSNDLTLTQNLNIDDSTKDSIASDSNNGTPSVPKSRLAKEAIALDLPEGGK